MEVYIYGCNCGTTRVYVNRVRKYATENNLSFILNNSKYDKEARAKHVAYLAEVGYESDNYEPIVVNSDSVERLREWSL